MTTSRQDDPKCHPYPAQNHPGHTQIPHSPEIPRFLQVPAKADAAGAETPIMQWENTLGLEVEVHGLTGLYRKGTVEAATANGEIIWIAQHGAHERKLIDKNDGYKIYLAKEELNYTSI